MRIYLLKRWMWPNKALWQEWVDYLTWIQQIRRSNDANSRPHEKWPLALQIDKAATQCKSSQHALFYQIHLSSHTNTMPENLTLRTTLQNTTYLPNHSFTSFKTPFVPVIYMLPTWRVATGKAFVSLFYNLMLPRAQNVPVQIKHCDPIGEAPVVEVGARSSNRIFDRISYDCCYQNRIRKAWRNVTTMS